jgi:hypothetical protein
MERSTGSTRRAGRAAALVLAAAAAANCNGPITPGGTAKLAVTAVSPSSVTTGGGTVITVTGTNFGSDAKVFIDSVALTNITVTGTTSITGTTSAHAAGTANLSVTSGGSTVPFTGTFSFVAPSGANAPPVISLIRTVGPRVNQPASFADIGDSVAVIATVTDATTPINQLTYAWTASTGTITGATSSATWVAPSTLATSPTTVTIQLTATETFTENSITHRQSTSSTVAVFLHDSNKELLDMSVDFLQLFSQQAPYEAVLHNFVQSCYGAHGYADEKGDIEHNQATFTQLPTWVLTRLPPVTLNFGGSCSLPTREPVLGDACARVHAHWDVQPKAGGPVEHANGVDQLTAMLENNQWRLCDSSFVDDSVFPPALEHQVMLDARTKLIKRY